MRHFIVENEFVGDERIYSYVAEGNNNDNDAHNDANNDVNNDADNANDVINDDELAQLKLSVCKDWICRNCVTYQTSKNVS